MGLNDLLNKFRKPPAKDEKETPDAAAPAEGQPSPRRRRPVPPLPGWAKKDNAFVRKDMGMMKPPEDMAEEASFKRPDSWLKRRLGGVSSAEGLDNLEKTKENVPKKKALSDSEIENFLSDLLGEEGPEKPDSGKEGA